LTRLLTRMKASFGRWLERSSEAAESLGAPAVLTGLRRGRCWYFWCRRLDSGGERRSQPLRQLASVVFRRPRGRLPLRPDKPPVQPSVALLAARQEVRPGQGQIRPMADGLDVVDISRSPSAALATDGLSSQDGIA